MELVKNSLEIKKILGDIPILAASIRVTKRCNAFCKHCYGNSGEPFNNELTTREIKKLIDVYSDEFGVKKIFFTGGEPFARGDIVEILQYAYYKNMEILISTNGSLLTKNILKEIQNINFSMFQISIDGPKEIHNKIRGDGFFEKAINALKLLKELNFKNVTIATCLMRENYDQINKIIDIVVEYEADIYSLVLLLVAGRANSELDVTSQELKLAINDLFSAYRKYKGKFKLAENSIIPPALVPADLREEGLHKQFEVCCAFPNIIGIEANGDVAPCDGFFTFTEYIAGNIRESSVLNIWERSNVFSKLSELNRLDIKGVCSKCIFLSTCAGSCRASAYAYYKDIHAPFPTCQKLYEEGLFPPDCIAGE